MKKNNEDDVRSRRLEKLRFWRRACADQAQKWTCYNTNQPGSPLIFFHGDTDMGGLYVRRLAAECGFPIAALAPPSLHDKDIRPSVESMASLTMKEIIAFQASGPFRIGGYCNGAVLAYECAQRLQAQGHQVEIIVMIEPPSINTRAVFRAVQQVFASLLPPAEHRSLSTQQRFGDIMYVVWNVGRLLHMSPREIYDAAVFLWQRQVTQRERLGGRAGAPSEAERQVRDIDLAFKRFHWRSVSTYLPPRTTIPVVALSTGFDGGGRRCGMYDGTQWVRVAKRFRHVRLPGQHSTCLSIHVSELATELRSIFQELLRSGDQHAPQSAGEYPLSWSSLQRGRIVNQ